jgi:hypothetical protein
MTHACRPLESNQNLSVFSQARNHVRQSGKSSRSFECQRTQLSRHEDLESTFGELTENMKAAVVSQGGLARFTLIRGYLAEPPEASLPASRPINESAQTYVCGFAFSDQFIWGFVSTEDSLLAFTNNSGTSICQTVFRRRIRDLNAVNALAAKICSSGSLSTAQATRLHRSHHRARARRDCAGPTARHLLRSGSRDRAGSTRDHR